MSTGGQAIGGVVGAVAGFFIGGGPTGALYGAQVGIMAGGYLDPPKGPTVNGPRLNDLTVQTSTYGAVIPRVYGMVTVNGNVIWLKGNALTETITKTKSKGGKGGGSKSTTLTYTYSASFAVGLCQGPIVGVRRIWIGPDLIYDAGSSDAGTIAASNAAATGFVVYDGSDTQAPDPTIQSDLGVANTPAWRGLAYIVFDGLALERYSNSLMGAQVRVEVLTEGVEYDYPVTSRTMPSSGGWSAIAWSGSVFCALKSNTDRVATSPDGVTWTETTMPVSSAWQDIAFGDGVFVAVSLTGAYHYTSPDGVTWTARSRAGSAGSTCVVYGDGKFVSISDSAPWEVSANGITWAFAGEPAYENGYGRGSYAKTLAWNGSVWVTQAHFGSNRFFSSPTAMAGTWTQRGVATGYSWNTPILKGSRLCVASSGGSGVYISDDGLTWTHYAASLPLIILTMETDGLVFLAVGQNDFFRSTDGITWTAGVDMPGVSAGWLDMAWSGSVFAATTNTAQAATIARFFVSGGTVGLGDIVQAECLQSSLLDAGDIDVTALTSEVRGYRIGSVGAIRAAIEPLQAAWPFDVVQHGYQIKFVARGGSSVVTIPAADLDARSDGSAPGVQITTSREMDSQIPRRVTVQHLDYDREYDAGSQYDERLNTDAINATTLDLPIVMTAQEAAGKAQVLLYLYWLERHDVAINLPPTYNQLEPGDVVTLTTPEGAIQLRLTATQYTSDGRLECKAKYANAAIYTPTSLGASSAVTGAATITPVGASVYYLLDVPMMTSLQSGPSWLAGMAGALAGWKGGSLLQSIDGGATWTILQDFGPPGATFGTASNSIGVVESRVIDAASVLSVDLSSGELYSVTQLAMLGGTNHFAYGLDGRWEIIAAQTCTLVTGTSYVLSNLLRGRFGTEWAMGLHAVGDSLILLDTDDIEAIGVTSASIGLSLLYRGVTSGRDIGSDIDRVFTYRGVNLKPLSPISLSGSREPSTNDWTLTWIRRTRTGGEWRDYVDADLGEASEAYQIDIYSDGTYATVKRTLTTTSPAAAYSSANQVADFGANQTTLYLKVYQISATVGRGYPLQSSITR